MTFPLLLLFFLHLGSAGIDLFEARGGQCALDTAVRSEAFVAFLKKNFSRFMGADTGSLFHGERGVFCHHQNNVVDHFFAVGFDRTARRKTGH